MIDAFARARRPSGGFTLIEMLIYLGLFSLIMTAALEAMLAISESSSKDAARAALQEEGSFLSGKIDWMIGQGIAVRFPAPGTRGQSLSVSESNGTVSTVTVSEETGSLSLARNSAHSVLLSDSGIRVNDLSFEHVASVRDGVPEHVHISFTLTATSSIGVPIGGTFSETSYVP